MTRRGAVIGGAVVLILIAAASWQQRRYTQARAEAQAEREVSRAALQRETQAKAQATEWKLKAESIQAHLNTLPADPGPRPIDPSASVLVVAAELRGLGLTPALLGDGLGLTLPDARTTVNWGREAQRVGPLAARLETTTALAQALHSQASDLTTALGACDERAASEQRRADALDRALRATGAPRNWTAGLLVGMDTDARRHLGAYVGWSYKAVHVQAITINNTVALGAGYRF